MAIRVAINGMGRIGRMVFRAGFQDPKIEFVAVNNPSSSVADLAHFLRYDSVHRKFPGKIEHDETHLTVDGKRIEVLSERDPELLPWKKLGVDIVVESTGVFLTRELAAKHLKAGARKVLLSAPPKSPGIKTFLKGVNEHEYDKARDDIISNASCTTNCFAPMAKVLHDNFKIVHGFMVTVHGYTADQMLVDGNHFDLRRARAAAVNLVPTTSGAEKAIQEIIPALKGKLHSSAVRAPVVDGSLCYFACDIGKQVSVQEINQLFRNVSEYQMKGILEYAEEPLVSTDIIDNPHSCIFDSLLTEQDGNMVKVVGGYDNEWGYSCRMIDLIKMML